MSLTTRVFLPVRIAMMTAGVVALSGCAVGPSSEQPNAHLPDHWRASSSAPFTPNAVEQQWWNRFGDPLLTELVLQAQKANFDLQSAALRVAQSRAQRSIVTGARLPAIVANASQQRYRQSEVGAGTRLIDVIGVPGDRDTIIDALSEPYDVYHAGFDASWELDLWGRVRRAAESADASVILHEEELHAARLSIVAQVSNAYLDLRGVQEHIRVTQRQVDTIASSLELTRMRAAAGSVTELDVIQQQAQLIDVRARLPQLQDRRAQLINALSFLLAQPPGDLEARVSATQTVPSPPSVLAVGIPSQLARQRPDIRAAEARLQIATAQVGVAVADLYPRISLGATAASEALDAGDFGTWDSRQWSIGPILHLPIFDGGRRRSTVALRELQQQEAAVHYQRTVLQAWHEIESAMSAYRAEQQHYQELSEQLALSRDAYEIANVRYEHGMTDFLVALDARRSLLQAEVAVTDSRTRIANLAVALYKSVGTGWTR